MSSEGFFRPQRPDREPEQPVEQPAEEEVSTKSEEPPFTLERGKEVAIETRDQLKEAGWEPIREMVGEYVGRFIGAARGLARGFAGDDLRNTKKKRDE